MEKIELVFVSRKTYGKYTSTLEWCVKDDVWIDNCFKSTVTDKAGTVIEIIDEIRPIPEKVKPAYIVPPPIEGGPPIENTGKLWYFDPLYPNEKYTFSPPLQKSITAWVIKVNDDVFIFDVETGKNIGRNTIWHVSATGLCPTCGGSAPLAVYDWFPKLGFPIAHRLGIDDEVQEYLKDNNIKYWHADAHGSPYWSQLYTPTEIQEAMANRSPMWVAILGHCSVMKETGPGTLSYAFRKGSMKGTVTIGLKIMSCLTGRWLRKMFEKVYSGSTWKEGFDYASAAIPQDGDDCAFCGDEAMKLEGNGTVTPPVTPPITPPVTPPVTPPTRPPTRPPRRPGRPVTPPVTPPITPAKLSAPTNIRADPLESNYAYVKWDAVRECCPPEVAIPESCLCVYNVWFEGRKWEIGGVSPGIELFGGLTAGKTYKIEIQTISPKGAVYIAPSNKVSYTFTTPTGVTPPITPPVEKKAVTFVSVPSGASLIVKKN